MQTVGAIQCEHGQALSDPEIRVCTDSCCRLVQMWPGGKFCGVQQSTWESGGNDLQEQLMTLLAGFHIDFTWQSGDRMALQL